VYQAQLHRISQQVSRCRDAPYDGVEVNRGYSMGHPCLSTPEQWVAAIMRRLLM
jgi:hypothetical protein